ncbi:MAG TPA: tyrosine-type recombinase/integrase [Alicyclobacillus sp.]|nr:tyrosine-type recombinase/integrase [Alicyclobacillus sp.]
MAEDFYEAQMDAFLFSNRKRYRNVKGPITLHEGISVAVSEWAGQGKSSFTIKTYQRHLMQFAKFAHKAIEHPAYVSRIDRFCVAKYRTFLYKRVTKQGKRLSGRSIQLHLDSLRAFFKVMKDLGYVPTNPVEEIESKEYRRARVATNPTDESPLTMEKLIALLTLDFRAIGGYWGLRDKALFYVLTSFGLRESELRKLKWSHLQEDILILPRCKRNSEGVYQVRPDLRDLLYKVREVYGLRGDDPMFISQNRCQLSKTGLQKRVKKYGEMIGLPNLCATHFRTRVLSEVSREHDPITVQNYIGHKSPDTANRWYIKRPKRELQRVYESISDMLPPIRLDSDPV